MEIEKVLAMAVAAIAEENGVHPRRVIVRSFKEVRKSSLDKYLEENKIAYVKYRLEGTKA